MTGEENRKAALALIRGIIGDATVMVESARDLERKPDEALPSASAPASAPVGKDDQQAEPGPSPQETPAAPQPPETLKEAPRDEPEDKPKANSQSDVLALLKRPTKK